MKKRTLRSLIITYSLIGVAASVAFVIRWISGLFPPELNIIIFFASLILLSAGWESLRFIHFRLNLYYPFERSIPGRMTVQLVLGIMVAIVLRFLIYKLGEPHLPFALDSLFLASTWAIFALASAGVNTTFFIRYFIERWKDSLVQTERLEKEKAQIQFDNLKNQLNPHFLFNALTSLNSLIAENPSLASQFLQQMSKVYRYVLQNKERTVVNLQTELEFIRNYTFLAETRFDGALKFSYDVSAVALEHSIVPVTLQILIENAIKHNIIDKEKPLLVEIFSSGDYLVVTNNLQPRKTVETSNKQGLGNLESLYRFITARPILVERSASRFTVKVPLI